MPQIYWSCNTCGHKCQTEQEAVTCESEGENYKYALGESALPDITIEERAIRFSPFGNTHHYPFYKVKRKRFEPQWLSEQEVESLIYAVKSFQEHRQ